MPTKKSKAQRLREIREQAGLSREALAMLIRRFPTLFGNSFDIWESTIEKWESGKLHISAKTMAGMEWCAEDQVWVEEQKLHLPSMKFTPVWPMEKVPENWEPDFFYVSLYNDGETVIAITDEDTANELQGFYKPTGHPRFIPPGWQWNPGYYNVRPDDDKNPYWRCPFCENLSFRQVEGKWQCGTCGVNEDTVKKEREK